MMLFDGWTEGRRGMGWGEGWEEVLVRPLMYPAYTWKD